jgi:hypothetical protein
MDSSNEFDDICNDLESFDEFDDISIDEDYTTFGTFDGFDDICIDEYYTNKFGDICIKHDAIKSKIKKENHFRKLKQTYHNCNNLYRWYAAKNKRQFANDVKQNQKKHTCQKYKQRTIENNAKLKFRFDEQ